MNCPNCLAQLPDDANTCQRCGNTVSGANAVPAAQPGMGGGARTWSESDRSPFKFAGRWWTRGPLGEVLHYEPTSGAWERTPELNTPFFMRRPKFTSLRVPAITLYILFGLYALISAVGVVATLGRADLLGELAAGDFVSQDDLDASDAFFGGMIGFAGLVNLAIAAVFIWWTRRATCNVRSLGAHDPEFTPGWSVGWWFIPFANYVQPFRVINQAWASADPTLPADLNREYKKAPRSWLILAWWLGYQVANSVWGFAFNLAESEDLSFAGRQTAAYWVAAGQAGMVVAAALAIAVVARLTRRQDVANATFDLPGGLDTVPGSERMSAVSEPVTAGW